LSYTLKYSMHLKFLFSIISGKELIITFELFNSIWQKIWRFLYKVKSEGKINFLLLSWNTILNSTLIILNLKLYKYFISNNLKKSNITKKKI
jgi:hypothetical protein